MFVRFWLGLHPAQPASCQPGCFYPAPVVLPLPLPPWIELNFLCQDPACVLWCSGPCLAKRNVMRNLMFVHAVKWFTRSRAAAAVNEVNLIAIRAHQNETQTKTIPVQCTLLLSSAVFFIMEWILEECRCRYGNWTKWWENKTMEYNTRHLPNSSVQITVSNSLKVT